MASFTLPTISLVCFNIPSLLCLKLSLPKKKKKKDGFDASSQLGKVVPFILSVVDLGLRAALVSLYYLLPWKVGHRHAISVSPEACGLCRVVEKVQG